MCCPVVTAGHEKLMGEYFEREKDSPIIGLLEPLRLSAPDGDSYPILQNFLPVDS